VIVKPGSVSIESITKQLTTVYGAGGAGVSSVVGLTGGTTASVVGFTGATPASVVGSTGATGAPVVGDGVVVVPKNSGK